VATVLNAWGWLEIARGQPNDARPYLERALKIREETFGQEHLDVVDTLAHLAALDNGPESVRKGHDRYKRARELHEKLLGAEHPSVARLLRAEAMLMLEEKQFPEASTCLDRALAIQEKALRPSHPDLAATLESYVSVLRAATPPDLTRANDMETRAKSVREKESGEDRPEL
jgi:tetratricopeptide (TPR) repeat protein